MPVSLSADALDGEVIADYELDIDYEPEGSDPELKPVNQVQEEADPDVECTKMEIPYQRPLCQRSMSCKIKKQLNAYIKHEDLRLCPCSFRI